MCGVLPIVETRDLRKVFRTPKRTPGALGALRSLFSREYEERVAVGRRHVCAWSPASSSATSVPTAPASPRRSRCSPASSCRRRAQVRVAGLVPWKQRKENARNIGVVFGQRSQLYWDLPLVESFELLRAIYGIPPDEYRRNLDEFVEILEMDDFLQHAGAPALAGPADARRFRRGAAARPEDRLSRRADDRTRRRRKGGDPRVHRANQRRARNDDRSDDARPRRRRAPLPAHRPDRSRERSSTTATSNESRASTGAFARSSCASANRSSSPQLDGAQLVGVEDSTRALSLRPQRCSAPICSCGKRVSVTASKTSAWRSRISNRSSGASTSRGTSSRPEEDAS